MPGGAATFPFLQNLFGGTPAAAPDAGPSDTKAQDKEKKQKENSNIIMKEKTKNINSVKEDTAILNKENKNKDKI